MIGSLYPISNRWRVPTFGNIGIGKDEGWSDGLLKALNQLKANYDYVFISLEDLPITEKISQPKLDGMIDEFLKCDGNFLTTFRNYQVITLLKAANPAFDIYADNDALDVFYHNRIVVLNKNTLFYSL